MSDDSYAPNVVATKLLLAALQEFNKREERRRLILGIILSEFDPVPGVRAQKWDVNCTVARTLGVGKSQALLAEIADALSLLGELAPYPAKVQGRCFWVGLRAKETRAPSPAHGTRGKRASEETRALLRERRAARAALQTFPVVSRG